MENGGFVSPVQLDTLNVDVFGVWHPEALKVLRPAAEVIRNGEHKGPKANPMDTKIKLGGQWLGLVGAGDGAKVIAECKAVKLYVDFPKNPLVVVKQNGVGGRPACRLHFGAVALRENGEWRQTVRTVLEWLSEFFLIQAKGVGRGDLAVDQTSNEPEPGWVECAVGRAKVRSWIDGNRVVSEEELKQEILSGVVVGHFEHRHLTGFTAGTRGSGGSAFSRIYNKLLQAKRTPGLEWVERYLKELGWNGELPPGGSIWRAEFELLRHILRQLHFYDLDAFLQPGSLEQIFKWCTCYPSLSKPRKHRGKYIRETVHRGFQRLIVQGGDRADRSEIHPFWARLHRACDAVDGRAVRLRSATLGSEEAHIRAIRGHLANLCVLRGWEPETALEFLGSSENLGELRDAMLKKAKLLPFMRTVRPGELSDEAVQVLGMFEAGPGERVLRRAQEAVGAGSAAEASGQEPEEGGGLRPGFVEDPTGNALGNALRRQRSGS